MNALELCQRNVVTVRANEDLSSAAWKMRERNVGCLLVVEPVEGIGGERPIGVLTDRDIVTNVIARGIDPRNVAVEDVMLRHPVTVWAQSPIDDALQRMRKGGARRAPVVDDRGRLVGILSLGDIFEHMQHPMPFARAPFRRELGVEQIQHQPGSMGIERI